MKDEQNCYTCRKSTENCGINRALKYDFEPCGKWEGEQPEPKCKRCKDTGVIQESEVDVMPCPDCNQQEGLKPVNGLINKDLIMKAWLHLRKTEFTIPNETLDFMRDSALERITRHDAGKE